jgi:Ser/Thr protein kinase RdoA (MazF antagonist)
MSELFSPIEPVINQVAAQFINTKDEIVSVDSFGSGNINDTFLVTARAKPLTNDELITSIYQKSQGNLDQYGNPVITDSEPKSYKFVLQKINTHVFKQPELVMANIRAVTEHIQHKLGANRFTEQRYNTSPLNTVIDADEQEDRATENHDLNPANLDLGDLENFDPTAFDPTYFNANLAIGQTSQGLMLPNFGSSQHKSKNIQSKPRKTPTKPNQSGSNFTDQVSNNWVTPTIIPTQSNHDLYLDQEQNHWRSLTFIDHTIVLQTITESAQAYEVGYGVGYFHHLLRDLPLDTLADTLPEFHITPLYFQQYQQAYAKFTKGKQRHGSSSLMPELKFCCNFIEERTKLVSILEDAKSCGWLPLRVMHGDPKINNILLDESSQKAVSMIDLDTVKPGLVHYDIGDGLRSACNLMGEETEHWESVIFDVDVCQTWLRGYMQLGQNLLRPREFDFICEAMRLISLELGLRFLTDYLAGNRYFKTTYPEQNLIRALVQLRLTETIENQARNLRQIIREFYK